MRPVPSLLPLAVLLVYAKFSFAQTAASSAIIFPDDDVPETNTQIPSEVVTVHINSSDADTHVSAVEGLLGTKKDSEEKPDLSPAAIGGRSVFDPRAQYPSNEGCYTPHHERGECLNVRQCPGIHAIRDVSYLRRFLCGYEGQTPLICCPYRWRQQRQQSTPGYQRPTYGYPQTTYGYPQSTYGHNNGYNPNYNQYPQTHGYTQRPTYTRPVYPTYPTHTTQQYHRPVPTQPITRPTPRPTPRPTAAPTRPAPSANTEIRPRKPAFIPDRCGIHKGGRIVGGEESTPGAWPWMAAIYIQTGTGYVQACGGALVSSRYVVTAAHCVVSGSRSQNLPPRIFQIRLGDHDLNKEDDLPSGTTKDVKVSKITRHTDFDPKTYKNDIAILQLEEDVSFSEYIAPVCLPYNAVYGTLARETAVVTGWGYTKYEGKGSDVLKEANIRVWSEAECKEAFKKEVAITSEYLCAGDGDGKTDSCQGDSGGPLVYEDGIKYYLVGVVSFGKKCATPGYPGAYTRVTKYLQWLNDHF